MKEGGRHAVIALLRKKVSFAWIKSFLNKNGPEILAGQKKGSTSKNLSTGYEGGRKTTYSCLGEKSSLA